MALADSMRKYIAVLLCAAVPAAVSASDWGGMITTSSGRVTLNDHPIRGSHTMELGDLLKTGNGRAMVRLANGNVAVSENTYARFDGSAVQLSHGFAEISGTKELTTHYRDLTMHSAGTEPATFVVGEVEGKPTVAIIRGAVLVSNPSGSLVLPAGRAIEADDGDAMEPVSDAQEGQEGRPAEPAVKGGKGSKQDQQRGGRRNRKALAGWQEAVILAGLIGGTLGALALGGVFDKKPVSNQVP